MRRRLSPVGRRDKCVCLKVAGVRAPALALALSSAAVALSFAGCAGFPHACGEPGGGGLDAIRIDGLDYNRPPASPAPSPPFSRPEGQVGRLRRSRTVLIDGLADAEPALLREVPSAMPALTPTIYAHGAIWFGYNLATAQGGHLEMFDAGEGRSIGVAFGNGQDVKRFFEVAYEATGRHKNFAPAVTSATYERVYLGFRRYLLPVAAEESKRIAPLAVIGVTLQNFDAGAPIPTPVGNVQEADGIGYYVGTGIEFYVGGSSQLAISLDVRVSVLNFDAFPASTGRQRQVGGALAVVYHF